MATGQIPTSPYQLNGNFIFPNVSNLIVETRPTDQIEMSDWRYNFLEALGKGQVNYGDGFQYLIETSIGEGYDLDFNDTNSLLKVYRPDIETVSITADRFRYYPISDTPTMSYFMFEDDYMVDTLTQAIWARPEKAAMMDWCNMGLKMLNDSKAETVNIDISGAASGSTAQERNNALQEAYSKLAVLIEGIADDASVYSAKYTNATSNQECSADKLVIYYNKKYLNQMMATILAPLFKGEAIIEMAALDRAVVIPNAAFHQTDKTTPTPLPLFPNLLNLICFVCVYERFNLFYKYVQTNTFTNPAFLNTTTMWRHVSGGLREVDHFFCVKVVDAPTVTP